MKSTGDMIEEVQKSEAKCRLRAAAPELLEALKDTLEQAEALSRHHAPAAAQIILNEQFAKAHAAIAKAEGK